MKKFFAMAMVAMLMTGMAGCGNKNESSTDANAEGTEAVTPDNGIEIKDNLTRVASSSRRMPRTTASRSPKAACSTWY